MAGVTIKGLDEALKTMTSVTDQVKAATDKGVVQTAGEILRSATLSINKQSNGEKRGRHVVSKKGDAPNTDTGRLVGSISIAHQKLSQRAVVFSDLDYGAYLEFVLDRPWLGPAVVEKRPELKKNIAAAIDEVLAK